MKRLWPLLFIVPLLMAAWWGSTGFRRSDTGEISPSDEEITGSFILPDCPSDTSNLRFGAGCKDQASGKIRLRDAAGLRDF